MDGLRGVGNQRSPNFSSPLESPDRFSLEGTSEAPAIPTLFGHIGSVSLVGEIVVTEVKSQTGTEPLTEPDPREVSNKPCFPERDPELHCIISQ